jgi:hypothetical protein
MTDTAKRLVGPVALTTTAATTVYTVPASTTAILRSVHVNNESGSTATFTLSIGTDGAGKRLWSAVDIPTKSSFDWSGFIVMAAAEVIQSSAGTATALTLTVSGVEVT